MTVNMVNRISDTARERLRDLVEKAGTQGSVAAKAGMSRQTLQSILAGTTDPAFSKVVQLADALGLSLDEIASELGPESGDETTRRRFADDIDISIYEATVSAGAGTYPIEGPSSSYLKFDRSWWHAHHLGDPHEHILLTVGGDSMEPDLRAGDLVMIDMMQTGLRDGLFVIRLIDHLVVKRVQRVRGPLISLVSSNATYPTMPIDIQAEGDQFQIVGRVVWSACLR